MILDTVSSYAKLNLSLLVYSPRRDGYHPICSVFQEIDLSDTLQISESERHRVTVDLPALDGQPNILDRVFSMLAPYLTHHYHVHIQKNIPLGGGLGGGSTNAAALLAWLIRHERLTLPTPKILKIAGTLGADVSFFLSGGTALVRGIGEKVTPIRVPVSPFFVLINPNRHLDTASVYRAYDFSGPLPKPGPTPGAIKRGVVGANSFKPVVWALAPELATLELAIASTFQLPLNLSGSGATVFVCATDAAQATDIATWVGTHYPEYWVHVVRPISRYKNH